MDISSFLIYFIILIFSAILHEIAHGFVADRLGDPTARLLGRLTLNPRAHIDPMMTLALPLLLFLSGSPVIFGGAKPVPIDPFNLKEGRKDMALVSLAGPLTNILLALIAGLLIKLLQPSLFNQTLLLAMLDGNGILQIILQVNLLLAIFNLLPIPPLDGSKIVALILPEKEAAAYLRIGNLGMLILFFLLAFPIPGFSLPAILQSLFSFAYSLFRFGT